ncbi:hypothetical protein GCM10007940_32970 [Portibacter lacus]|uniref:Uncharacterized protein n=2 Tax=Portibacter lacus TaxID=1099794 RepID=A0AA37STS7_9BACT|nr:hypothetical protein GCM10007940_32970 [Portibacter lacus]
MKKITYVTMKDGSKLEGSFKGGQEALNGGWKWITFKPTDGKRMKIQAADIKSMLVPESKLSKLSEATSIINDATKWDQDVTLNKDAIKEGYYYYETTTLAKKKKDIVAVRQILNPGYSDKIKVLDNKAGIDGPTARLGGIKVAGGNDRSYFIIVGDAKAIKVSAKKYDEQFLELFAACPEFVDKYKSDISWSDIEKHVFEFSQSCKE